MFFLQGGYQGLHFNNYMIIYLEFLFLITKIEVHHVSSKSNLPCSLLRQIGEVSLTLKFTIILILLQISRNAQHKDAKRKPIEILQRTSKLNDI